MHKDLNPWYAVHASSSHVTEMIEAGGFLYLVCVQCHVMQTVDEVAAGAPIAPEVPND